MGRFDKSIDQIALTYDFKNPKPKGDDIFDRVLPAAGRRSQAVTPALVSLGERKGVSMEPGFVSLDGVSHPYGGIAAGPDGVLAVEDLTITVNRGEFAAVVGPSGCGKSTLMKLATGLQFPLAGMSASPAPKCHQPLKIAGMAFQAPTLLPWRTTLDNLLLPLEIVQPHRRDIAPQQGAICRSRRDAAGLGRARRLRQQVSLATVRRHAAARLALPRAHPRAAAADAGRAVRRARRLHARGTVVRDPRPARGARRSPWSSSPTTCARRCSSPTASS